MPVGLTEFGADANPAYQSGSRYVDKPNPSYIMDGSNTANWFDDPAALLRPGYFSVMDTVADIKDNPEAAAIYHAVIDPIMEAHKAAGVGIKAMIPENLHRFCAVCHHYSKRSSITRLVFFSLRGRNPSSTT